MILLYVFAGVAALMGIGYMLWQTFFHVELWEKQIRLLRSLQPTMDGDLFSHHIVCEDEEDLEDDPQASHRIKSIPLRRFGNYRNLSTLPPVVIIPGLGGSQLFWRGQKRFPISQMCNLSQEEWASIWISMETLFPTCVGGSCFVDNFRPLYDTKQNKWVNSPSIEVQPLGFGTLESIDTLFTFAGMKNWSITYFRNFTNRLRRYGYQDQVNLFGAPYDFRVNLSPDVRQEYFKKLKTLIETAYLQNHQTKVAIVTHSMGSPTAQVFFNQFVDSGWKSKYIQSFIPISAAWGGSPRATEAMLSGVNLVVIPRQRVKQLVQPMSGTAWMLPDPNLYPLKSSVRISNSDNVKQDYSFGNKDMSELLKQAGLHPDSIKGIEKHVFSQRQTMFQAPRVPTFPINGRCLGYSNGFGEGRGQACSLIYERGDLDQGPSWAWNESVYYQAMRDDPSVPQNHMVNRIPLPASEMVGDFTVPYLSLQIPKYMWNQSEPVVIKEFVGSAEYNHAAILSQPEVVDYAMQVIMEHT